MHRTIINDDEFDALGRELAERYDEVTHPNKDLVSPEWCPYSGLDLPHNEWPLWVGHMANTFNGD